MTADKEQVGVNKCSNVCLIYAFGDDFEAASTILQQPTLNHSTNEEWTVCVVVISFEILVHWRDILDDVFPLILLWIEVFWSCERSIKFFVFCFMQDLMCDKCSPRMEADFKVFSACRGHFVNWFRRYLRKDPTMH